MALRWLGDFGDSRLPSCCLDHLVRLADQPHPDADTRWHKRTCTCHLSGLTRSTARSHEHWRDHPRGARSSGKLSSGSDQPSGPSRRKERRDIAVSGATTRTTTPPSTPTAATRERHRTKSSSKRQEEVMSGRTDQTSTRDGSNDAPTTSLVATAHVKRTSNTMSRSRAPANTLLLLHDPCRATSTSLLAHRRRIPGRQ